MSHWETVAVTLALGTLLCVSACTERRGAEPAEIGQGGSARRYTVRAEVLRLPTPTEPRPEVVLRHEAIDDFVDARGRTVGMDAMVMPFAVGSAATIAGISVGDKVKVRLAVDWSGPTLRIEEMVHLPADTVLHFDHARAAVPAVQDGGAQ